MFSPLEGVGGANVAGRCGVSPHGGWRKTKKSKRLFVWIFLVGAKGVAPLLIF